MFSFFLQKELKDRYLGNSSALIWIVLQPIATLLTYYLVFGLIFKARIENIPDNAFITYLAIGLWPWMAFSESILASIDAIVSRKDLLGKVKIDLRQVVLAGTTTTFILHGIGYLIILLLLMAFDRLDPHIELIYLLVPMFILYLMAVMFSLFLSALQVFYRDAKQIVSSIMPLVFFCTPIIYSWSLIPDQAKAYFAINPLVPVVEFIHHVAFNTAAIDWLSILPILAVSLLLLYLSNQFFLKLAPRFDDFV